MCGGGKAPRVAPPANGVAVRRDEACWRPPSPYVRASFGAPSLREPARADIHIRGRAAKRRCDRESWRSRRPLRGRSGTDGAFPAAVRSEEHTSELQSLMRISYAVFCLKKKKYYSSTSHDNSEFN